MIDLNELKPILEKLDVDASVIESIIAIDKEVEPSDNSKEVEDLKAQLEQTNKDWNEKIDRIANELIYEYDVNFRNES